LVCFGIFWLGLTSILRTFWFSGADFWILAAPQLVQGLGMPFFFIPLTIIALGAVDPEETASAAGVMSFLRTLAAAIGTSIGSTLWQNGAQQSRAELTNIMNNGDQVIASATQHGYTAEQGRGLIERVVEQESFALATTHIFALAALVFFVSAAIIWLAPRPARPVDTSAAH
jgi:DHA2 family multidrug resistance protein